MLTTIHDARAIKAAQSLFEERVAASSARSGQRTLGFQGCSVTAEVYRLSEANVWVAITALDNRYWNALGTGNPFKEPEPIVVEINPPISGFNRRVSGVFLTDSVGSLYMGHRGRIGGGRKGIGKTAFRQWYPKSFASINDCGAPASVILIGGLRDKDFIENLSTFTHHVAEFKRAATTTRMTPESLNVPDVDKSIPTWKLVLDCAQKLTARGEVPFTRKQLIECIQFQDPERKPGTINPIIQGMTVNIRGGPTGGGRGYLKSVGRGQFMLVNADRQAPESVAESPRPRSPSRPEPLSLNKHPKKTIAGIEFWHVCNLNPELQPDGSIRIIRPQSGYMNHANLPLNRYGAGPFCRFRIPRDIRVAGVYVISRNETVLYVGECEHLSQRFNMGYGQISPRNCFKGGQETNCRINALVLSECLAGHTLSLHFHPCDDYKRLEARLRREIRPDWNRT